MGLDAIIPFVNCNRCGTFLKARRGLRDSIQYHSTTIMVLETSVGEKAQEARARAESKIERLLKVYAERLSKFYKIEISYEPMMLEQILENPRYCLAITANMDAQVRTIKEQPILL